MPPPQPVRRDPNAIVRPLTAGELRLARSVFGAALDPNRVRVHNRPYLPRQGKGIAMTPNGHVWFNPTDYKPDFSRRVTDAAWLVHELTHAWQYQSGRSTRMRGLLEQFGRLWGSDPYPYGAVDPGRRFASYKNEQQAAMVEDYYRVREGLKPRFGSGSLRDYELAIPFVPKTIRNQGLPAA